MGISNTKDGTLSVRLLTDYKLKDGTTVIALERYLESDAETTSLITYYQEDSDLMGLIFKKTPKVKGEPITFLNVKYVEGLISYEYSYRFLNKKQPESSYELTGIYLDNGRVQTVTAISPQSIKSFQKFIDRDDVINYSYFQDEESKSSTNYRVMATINPENHQVIYGLSSSKHKFYFSEAFEDELISEFYSDDEVNMISFDGRIYKIPIEDDQCLPEELEFVHKPEENSLLSNFYQNSNHGPIYNIIVRDYLDYIDFFIMSSRQSFPDIPESLFDFDRIYLTVPKNNKPGISFDRLIVSDSPGITIENIVKNINIKVKKM